MYVLGNVQKFVKDKADRIGDEAEGILARAKERADSNGIVPGDAIAYIMGEGTLAREFERVATNDIDHIQLVLSGIRLADL